MSVTDIVEQAKSLCGQYIRARLKRSGVFNRKLGLQRLRSVANLPGGLGKLKGNLRPAGNQLLEKLSVEVGGVRCSAI